MSPGQIPRLLLMSHSPGHAVGAAGGDNVRQPCCAGDWYPREADKLAAQVDDLLERSTPPALPGKPLALIAPHAGYRFSAPVAAAAYATLRGQTFRRVIAFAFSHRRAGSYRGIDVPRNLAAYATPLGEVAIDRAVCNRLKASSLFADHPGTDAGEHSLELQLPFLQRALRSPFGLVPLYVGQMNDRDHAAAAHALQPHVDDDTLVVVSTDFTHYGAGFGYVPFTDDVPRRLVELAEQAAAPILRCDYDGFVAHVTRTDDTICGRGPVALLLRLLSMRGGATGVRAAFDTSGHMTGEWDHTVTYQSFVFVRQPAVLDAAERAELLRWARAAVTAHVQGRPRPSVALDKLPARLRADGACFVTLTNAGQLRGCIGNMSAEGPLVEAVVRNAVLACQDPRFLDHPVTAAELDQLHIEISHLTPLVRVKSPDEIVVGRHGLLIELGRQRGVLLPQVAYERGWTRAEFLAQTCHKAGLPPDAWKLPQAGIYSFEAEVFGE